MIANFFINRPIFAWVISIVIMLVGIGSIYNLPISQYPEVAPPKIKISVNYVGASAETVENSITQILEQQLTGLDGMLYFSSNSSYGQSSVEVTFQQGTDIDTAQVQVQNKMSQISNRLPTSVQQEGIKVSKSQNDFLMIVAIFDKNNKYTESDISDFLVSNIQDPLSRVDGVGSVQVFGGQYAMRIWLNPKKLFSYNLTSSEIASAIKSQNVQVSAGSIGALPTYEEQQLNATVIAKSKLQTVEEFEKIILKSDTNGATVYLKDVARIELGNENYGFKTRLNGYPASGIAIMLAPGANALSTANNVKEVVENLKINMPSGFDIAYPRDSTKFIKVSVKEVVKTLIEAIILVICIMYIFLQNFRATLIPAIAVPVVLLGTFGVLEIFGYSINTLTMFGVVLSIGLLVDDAIVVVENVERIMREEGLDAYEATKKSMKEISSALIGIATVLSAVFLPMAFFSGSTGVIYRQFSITIVSSMILSVIVALSLTPALCATLLKKHEIKQQNIFFNSFNKYFDILTEKYKFIVNKTIKNKIKSFMVYLFIILGMGVILYKLPTGFIPSEDQGQVMVQFSLPEGAGLKRTLETAKEIENYFSNNENKNTEEFFTISGFSFGGSGQNAGMAFLSLKDWDERKNLMDKSDAISMRATVGLSKIRDARIFALNPPAIQGLGQSNGFSFNIQALSGTDRETLFNIKEEFLNILRQNNTFSSIRDGSMGNTTQLKIDINSMKAKSMSVSLSEIDDTINYAWAGNYINDFVDRGKVKKVYLQGDYEYRSSPENINDWYVKNNNNTMTSLENFTNVSWIYGPQALSRYNGLASYEIQGSPSNGISSGDAMNKIEELIKQYSDKVTFAWSGLSYQEKQSSGQTPFLYSISILFVFLCLAALYESWTIPFSVILVIPLGIFGSVLSAYFRDLNNDVYFQVALITIIGLSSKNAILIVEFAEQLYNSGKGLIESTIEGAKMRLRPILMTSLAFIAGVLPLALSTGAGANSRISIGTGIVGGTLTATFFAIFLIPLFFIVIRTIFNRRKVIKE